MYCSGQVFIYSMSGPQADVEASQEITEIQVQYIVHFTVYKVNSVQFMNFWIADKL